jgi:V/A-type H+-transporting ATPase subunit E
MNQNLQALTEKIYREGIEKAEEQGSDIIRQAKEEAQQIIADAEQKAASLIEQTEKEAADLARKNEAEMRLASRQALSSLKQQIADLLIWKVTSDPVKKAFKEQEFVQRIIEKLIDYWLANFGQEERLTVLLPERDFEALQKYFQLKAQHVLQQNVVIRASNQMKDGFQISPEDGSFKVNFTSEDFENYFKTFARPGAFRLLFGDQI